MKVDDFPRPRLILRLEHNEYFQKVCGLEDKFFSIDCLHNLHDIARLRDLCVNFLTALLELFLTLMFP